VDRTEWDRRYATSELVWTAEPNRFVVAEVAELPAGTALDLAAGEGRNAVWLAQRGWRVTAVDFSAVGLDKARRLAADRDVELTAIVADATTWQPAAPFDLVLVAYLQLPPPERNAALRRAAGAVAPGGTLLVVGHDRANLDHGYGGPQDPAVLLTPDEIVADLHGSGLVVDKAERVQRPVDTPEGPRVAIDTLVRAHRPCDGGGG
jgi:SAM-dependent methyltransferase